MEGRGQHGQPNVSLVEEYTNTLRGLIDRAVDMEFPSIPTIKRSTGQQLSASTTKIRFPFNKKINQGHVTPSKRISTPASRHSHSRNGTPVTVPSMLSTQSQPPDILRNKISNQKRHKSRKLTYSCSVCSKKFDYDSDRKRHEVIHSRPFKCTTCHHSWDTEARLTRHLEVAHLLPATNVNTNVTTTSVTAINVTKRNYNCNQCPFTTMFQSGLYSHMKRHGTQLKFKCGHCSCTFSHRSAFHQHMKRVHPTITELQVIKNESKPKLKPKPSQPSDELLSKLPPIFKCILCSKTFPNETDLRRHVGHHTMSISCSLCEKRFAHDLALKCHIVRVHCRKSSQRSRSQSRKKNNAKPAGQPPPMEVPCPVCEVKLVGKTKLYQHLKIYHPKFQAYACSDCPFRTFTKDGLRRHNVIHVAVDIFKCGYCTGSFPTLSAREQHIDSVHPGMTCDLREEPLAPRRASSHLVGYYKVTEVVNLNVRSGGGGGGGVDVPEVPRAPRRAAHPVEYYKRTEVANSNFGGGSHGGGGGGQENSLGMRCRICKVKFPTRGAYLHHFKIHPNVKPYACVECGFETTKYLKFTAHEQLHKETHEFKCEYCSASFRYSISKTKHTMSIHKDEIEERGRSMPGLKKLDTIVMDFEKLQKPMPRLKNIDQIPAEIQKVGKPPDLIKLKPNAACFDPTSAVKPPISKKLDRIVAAELFQLTKFVSKGMSKPVKVRFPCNKCDAIFLLNMALKIHQQRCHPPEMTL